MLGYNDISDLIHAQETHFPRTGMEPVGWSMFSGTRRFLPVVKVFAHVTGSGDVFPPE